MASTAALLTVIGRLKKSVTGVAGDIRGLKDKLENEGVSDEALAELEGIASTLEKLDAETPEAEEPEEETNPEPTEPQAPIEE